MPNTEQMKAAYDEALASAEKERNRWAQVHNLRKSNQPDDPKNLPDGFGQDLSSRFVIVRQNVCWANANAVIEKFGLRKNEGDKNVLVDIIQCVHLGISEERMKEIPEIAQFFAAHTEDEMKYFLDACRLDRSQLDDNIRIISEFFDHLQFDDEHPLNAEERHAADMLKREQIIQMKYAETGRTYTKLLTKPGLTDQERADIFMSCLKNNDAEKQKLNERYIQDIRNVPKEYLTVNPGKELLEDENYSYYTGLGVDHQQVNLNDENLHLSAQDKENLTTLGQHLNSLNFFQKTTYLAYLSGPHPDHLETLDLTDPARTQTILMQYVMGNMSFATFVHDKKSLNDPEQQKKVTEAFASLQKKGPQDPKNEAEEAEQEDDYIWNGHREPVLTEKQKKEKEIREKYLAGIPEPEPVDLTQPLNDLEAGIDGLLDQLKKDPEGTQKIKEMYDRILRYRQTPPSSYGDLLIAGYNSKQMYKELKPLQKFLKRKKRDVSQITDILARRLKHGEDKTDKNLKADYEDMKQQRQAVTAFLPRMDGMLEALRNINQQVIKNVTLMEQGARQPVRSADGEFDLKANAKQMKNELNRLKKTLNHLETFGMSPEWAAMKSALNNTISDCRRAAETGETEAHSLWNLNSSLKNLQDTAHDYLVHKLDSGKFASGSDLERLRLAARLESFCMRELPAVEPKFKKAFKDGLHAVIIVDKKEVKQETYNDSWMLKRCQELDKSIEMIRGKQDLSEAAGALEDLKTSIIQCSREMRSCVTEGKKPADRKALSEQYIQNIQSKAQTYLEAKKSLKEKDADALFMVRAAKQIVIWSSELNECLKEENKLLKNASEQKIKQPAAVKEEKIAPPVINSPVKQ